MRNKKSMAVAWAVAASLSVVTQMASAKEFEPMQFVGEYPLTIVFANDMGLEKHCYRDPLPPVGLKLKRNHPKEPSKLELLTGWPYSDPKMLISDHYGSGDKTCRFVDEVTNKHTHTKILMMGKMRNDEPTGKGTWIDNADCSGSFIISRQK